MAISRQHRKWIEAGNFEALEDDWLARLAEAPEDVEWFVGVARPLAASGEAERAALLLGLVDEHLGEAESWEARLELLRRAGDLLRAPAELHAEILGTLGRIYEGYPSREGLTANVGLHRAIEDTEKNWQKVDRLRELLQFEVGAIVWMEGKGAGRVEEVNLELENFKIGFEAHPGLRVGFKAAGKLLRALSAEHILRRKIEEPERLRELKESDPPALLLAVLESYDAPRTAAEVRRVLAGIVDDSEWASWWAAARKGDRILTAGGGGRQSYTYARSGDHAAQAVRDEFAAADPPRKLELFRRNADRSPELKQEMAEALAAIGGEARTRAPELAFAVWLTLDKAGVDLSGLDWSARSLLAGLGGTVGFLPHLADRALRDRAYRWLPKERGDWTALYRDLLPREEDPRLLSLLADRLLDEAPELLRSFLDETTSQPRKSPAAFTWLAERAADERLTGDRNPLRLLQQILEAPRHDEFAPYRARLLKLWEAGGPFAGLLARLESDQAAAAETAIHRAPVEEYLRTPLINALHLRFDALRKPEESPLYALPDSIAARREELRKLKEEEIPANRKAIEEARALGDLRENFEYKSARQRHEYLSSRVAALSRDLGRVRPLEVPRGEVREMRIGCRLALRTDGGEERVLTLLGPWESRPDDDVISYESELGQQLLGLAPGDSIDLGGASYSVTGIEPCV